MRVRNAILIGLCIAMICGLCLGADTTKHARSHKPAPVQRNSDAELLRRLFTQPLPTPTIVEIRPTPKSLEELAQEARDREHRAENDLAAVATNERLVSIGQIQAFVFVLQLLVFGYQAYELRRTVRAAETQSVDTRASITQAARSANALEALGPRMEASAQAAAESVATLKERTAMQMRAYLSVIIGGATYQEREKNWRFEGKPLIVNAGNTPAQDVVHVTKAAILPVPLGDNALEDVSLDEALPGAPVGPHEQRILSAKVAGFVEDDQVEQIKQGQGPALYCWGVVRYRDIFGEEHRTEFCHILTWIGPQIMGYYLAGRNTAT